MLLVAARSQVETAPTAKLPIKNPLAIVFKRDAHSSESHIRASVIRVDGRHYHGTYKLSTALARLRRMGRIRGRTLRLNTGNYLQPVCSIPSTYDEPDRAYRNGGARAGASWRHGKSNVPTVTNTSRIRKSLTVL